MRIELFENDELPPFSLKIIGVGGFGCTVVDNLCAEGFNPDNCAMICCDLKPFVESPCPIKIAVSDYIHPKGLDWGNDPELCLEATRNAEEVIQEALKESRLNILVAGMGGGMGTGAGPFIADISKAMDTLTIAVISSPAHFEGKRRLEQARTGLEKLISVADVTIQIPLDRLLKLLPSQIFLKDFHKRAIEIFGKLIKRIYNLLKDEKAVLDGDFEFKRPMFENLGLCRISWGTGETAKKAIEMAISSPLLDDGNLENAKVVIFEIIGTPTLDFEDVIESAKLIQSKVHEDAAVIWGTSIDDSITMEEVFLIVTESKPENKK